MLNLAVCTYRYCQKEIHWLKKTAQLDESFSIRRVAAKYDISYKTLTCYICGAWEQNNAHAGAQRLTSEQERITEFKLNWIESDDIEDYFQVLSPTGCHRLPCRAGVHKGSWSKYGKTASDCVMTEMILGPTSRNYGEAGYTYSQTKKDSGEPRAVSLLLC